MPYYRECQYCGLNLDPGEICNCRKNIALGDETPKAMCLARTKLFYNKRLTPGTNFVKINKIMSTIVDISNLEKALSEVATSRKAKENMGIFN